MTISRRTFTSLAIGTAAVGSASATSAAAENQGAAGSSESVGGAAAGAQGKGVYVSGRWIPAPTTVSKEAHAFLADSPPRRAGAEPSDLNDKAAWRAYTDAGNRSLTAMMAGNKDSHPAEITTHQLGAALMYEIVPKSLAPETEGKAIYYIHGGAYIIGSGLAAAYMALSLADGCRMRAYAIDYRMPPDHPFPVGLNDAVAGYRELLKRFKPENIAIAGASAGGGLAASLVLKIRDSGLPIPGCCVLGTPEADLTESGDTFETNDTIDVVLQHRLTQSAALYANGHDLHDPYLSAVFGDFTKGFAPTILTSGTRDLFLSNTVLLHRALLRAGIEAELHVFEAMPHGGFIGAGAPEDKEVTGEQVRFIKRRLGITRKA
jgi:monoterpene epsilon-lactone hydrolase